MNIVLWHAQRSNPFTAYPVHAPMLWRGGPPETPTLPLGDDCLVIVPTSRMGILAALIVPDSLHRVVQSNGTALAAGVHLLRHTDHLVWGDCELYLAANTAAQHVLYDPETHGPDVFCFRTKARISPGEAIVICRGTPTESCGLIYRAAAWQPGLKCPQCKHDPQRAAWRPPPAAGGSNHGILDQLRIRWHR